METKDGYFIVPHPVPGDKCFKHTIHISFTFLKMSLFNNLLRFIT